MQQVLLNHCLAHDCRRLAARFESSPPSSACATQQPAAQLDDDELRKAQKGLRMEIIP